MSRALSASCAPGTTRKRLSLAAWLMIWRKLVPMLRLPGLRKFVRADRWPNSSADRRARPAPRSQWGADGTHMNSGRHGPARTRSRHHPLIRRLVASADRRTPHHLECGFDVPPGFRLGTIALLLERARLLGCLDNRLGTVRLE